MAVVDNFVWEGTPFLNKVKTEKKLRALGTVTKESIEDVPNPYENGTIRYTTLIFVEGLEVRFRKVTPTDDPDLVQVVVTSAK